MTSPQKYLRKLHSPSPGQRVSEDFKMNIRNREFKQAVMALALLLCFLAPILASSSALAAKTDSDQYQRAVSSLQAQSELERGDPGFWSYALSTLLIRFIGIFIVLGILQIVMQVSGRIFMAIERRKKEAKTA
jgi:ABC-type Fe3+ transport system permease subunit